MILENKVALVTGGLRGIGAAIAKELAINGAKVVITDIVPLEGEKEIVQQIIKLGGESKYFQADASKFSDAQASVDFTINTFGKLDILVNNAGITKDNLLLRMTEAEWDAVININLKSVFNYSKAAVRPMMNQRSGKIVNIASVVGISGNAGQANYVASKAGVIGLTKTLAKEFASRNINVNAVAPGFIDTEMTKKLPESVRQGFLQFIPLKRMGTPEDVAKVVLFLASSNADYLTGQTICVDGGMIMQ